MTPSSVGGRVVHGFLRWAYVEVRRVKIGMPDTSTPEFLDYPRLDYGSLVREYEDRLATIERGFGMDIEFLDGWVPDDDHNKGLYYLFEAALSHGLPGVSVELTPDLLASIDGEGLIDTLKALGGVHVARSDARVFLTVSFDGRLGEASDFVEVRGLSSLHRAYRDKLLIETGEITHGLDSTVEESEARYKGAGLRVVREPFQDGAILMAVEPTAHLARELRHYRIADGVGLRLVDLFCRRLEGASVQEVAEHGALRLENWLRDPLKPPPVRGLVTPETAGVQFAALHELARRLFRSYRQSCGTSAERNSDEQPLSPQWRHMSDAERIETVRVHLARELAARAMPRVEVRITKLVNDSQVFISLDGCASEREKRTLIRSLEKHLKAVVEPRIELYLPPASDRLKRDEQNPLFRAQVEVRQ